MFYSNFKITFIYFKYIKLLWVKYMYIRSIHTFIYITLVSNNDLFSQLNTKMIKFKSNVFYSYSTS